MEVLPSETRHRIYKILDLTVTARPDGELLASMVLAYSPKSCPQELASSSLRTPFLPSATGYRSACTHRSDPAPRSWYLSPDGNASV